MNDGRFIAKETHSSGYVIGEIDGVRAFKMSCAECKEEFTNSIPRRYCPDKSCKEQAEQRNITQGERKWIQHTCVICKYTWRSRPGVISMQCRNVKCSSTYWNKASKLSSANKVASGISVAQITNMERTLLPVSLGVTRTAELEHLKEMLILENVQNISCVYFLLGPKNEVLRVGKSASLYSRLNAHVISYVNMIARVAILPFSNDGEASTYEKFFIQLYKPPLNMRKPGEDDESGETVTELDNDMPNHETKERVDDITDRLMASDFLPLPHCKCLRCENIWTPRILNPAYCPACKSRYWNTERNVHEEDATQNTLGATQNIILTPELLGVDTQLQEEASTINWPKPTDETSDELALLDEAFSKQPKDGA